MCIDDPFNPKIYTTQISIHNDHIKFNNVKEITHSKRYLYLVDYSIQLQSVIREKSIKAFENDISPSIAEMRQILLLYKAYWQVTIQKTYIENCINYPQNNHICLADYTRNLNLIRKTNCVNFKEFIPFQTVDHWIYESFEPYANSKAINGEDFIRWSIYVMPHVARIHEVSQAREYLCPYCEVDFCTPKFYCMKNYKLHLCRCHGIVGKGKWIPTPIVIKTNHSLKDANVEIVCPTCFVLMNTNNISRYYEHWKELHYSKVKLF